LRRQGRTRGAISAVIAIDANTIAVSPACAGWYVHCYVRDDSD
jgi:hypothetical protein